MVGWWLRFFCTLSATLLIAHTPTIEEISEALKQLSSGKAPGTDAIPAEVLKHGVPALLSNIHQLFLTTWDSETVPQVFRDGTLVKLYKKKNKFNSGNYCGINLLSIARWSSIASGLQLKLTYQKHNAASTQADQQWT